MCNGQVREHWSTPIDKATMPKKGGKGKQAAMTEEERLLYMQQKAQAEEEMAKRKEDMLTQFLKVQFFSKVTMLCIGRKGLFASLSTHCLTVCRRSFRRKKRTAP